MKNSERKDELYGPVAININVVLFHSLHVIDSIINKTFGEWPTFWKTLTIKCSSQVSSHCGAKDA